MVPGLEGRRQYSGALFQVLPTAWLSHCGQLISPRQTLFSLLAQ